MSHKISTVSLVLLLTLALGACADAETPPDSAHGSELLASATCSETDHPTCPETPLPDVTLFDFQPQSPSFEKHTELVSFAGKPTVVTLLAGW